MSDEHFKPGSMGCHEVLHMTSFLQGAVDSELLGHESITSNPKWMALATKVSDGLAELYQAIGAEHLK